MVISTPVSYPRGQENGAIKTKNTRVHPKVPRLS
jgi:hypothetical protein